MIDLQKKIKDFCQENDLNCNIQSRILDIISELGELSKEILKSTQYGKIHSRVVSDNIMTEIGDVYFSLICLTNQLEVDAESAINMAIDKYKARLSTKSHIGSKRN